MFGSWFTLDGDWVDVLVFNLFFHLKRLFYFMNRIIIKPTDGLGSRIGVILSAYVLAQLFKKSGA